MIFMGLEKSLNKFILTNKLKTYHSSNLKLWLMFFSTLSFNWCKKFSECHFDNPFKAYSYV